MVFQVGVRFTALILSIHLLLRAAYHPCFAQHSDAEMTPPPSKDSCCNPCFQGPAGAAGQPGIPGVPGQNGQPGSRGQKGEPGVGRHGPKGDTGDSGQKGDQGEPGVEGLIGQPGMQGPTGPSGEKGVKGEPGESTYVTLTPPSVVAFMAQLGSSHFIGNPGDIIIFDNIEVNIGDAYDSGTGVFTCSVAGVYFFSVTFLSYHTGPTLDAVLRKNSADILYVYDNHPGFHHQSSNSAVLVLASGDTVRLVHRSASGGKIHCCPYSSFTGFLIQAM
ncbi:collagen alpha-1(X) chain-like [Acanthaster planci]|uniref:Collagen alpha-1(X) chain-like n=1 Tax=Acanthaster planci TaxID=133434 RepID=A0A8B7Z4Z9_ACAPL|nr:collagen alpha-1(X) chain-like [Acanthaster planci]